MSRLLSTALALATLLIWLRRTFADHACTAEVASACPERPGPEIAPCLKDPSQHDSPTELSSECTDYVAIHIACAEDIEAHCDEAWFSDDAIPCLTQWTSASSLTESCANVLKWAAPADEEADGVGPTDELGMSEQDRLEKLEWQKKRKEARGDAIERLKMKDIDRKKEEDRVALEQYKKEDPEGYAQMIAQQEEDARQKAEFKRRERARAAAIDRKRNEDLGIQDDAEKKSQSAPSVPGGGARKKRSGSSFWPFVGIVGVIGLGSWLYYTLTKGSKGGSASKGGKKKRS